MRLRRLIKASLPGCTTAGDSWAGPLLDGGFKPGAPDSIPELIRVRRSRVVVDRRLLFFQRYFHAVYSGNLLQHILHAVDATHAGHSLDFYDFRLHF